MEKVGLRILRHDRILKFPLFNCIRYRHDSRNILKLAEREMFETVFPDNASNEMHELFRSAPQTVYAGFDPTASSLHVGNLLILKNLLHWQRSGHNVIALVGGATALIGDPSGRSMDREHQVKDIVREQSISIKKNIEKIEANHEKYFWSCNKDAIPLPPFQYLNNEEWYRNVNVVEFLNTIGRRFRVGSMLLKDSVQTRLDPEFGRGLSFTEFSYQLFQAFDWYYLYNNHNCKFQIGGNDQMGNIEAGHKLIRKILNKPSYAFTMPLIKNDAGDKFGKSVENVVWLDPELTSPFEFYQFFMRLDDCLAEKVFKLFSFRQLNNIDAIIEDHKKQPHIRMVQSTVAEEVTLLVHGDEGLDQAIKTTSILYSKDIEKLGSVNPNDLEKLLPGCSIVECKFKHDYTVLDFSLDIRLFLSKVDAHRIIEAGGLYINLSQAKNPDEVLSQSVHILPNNITLIRVGKKNYTIVKWRTNIY